MLRFQSSFAARFGLLLATFFILPPLSSAQDAKAVPADVATPASATPQTAASRLRLSPRLSADLSMPPTPPRTAESESFRPRADVSSPRQALGKEFWISWVLTAGFAVSDVEITEHCLHYANCSEQNPLFGRRPARAEMYSVKASLTGLMFFFSRRKKLNRSAESSGWRSLVYTSLAMNSALTAWDLAQLHKVSR